MNEPTTGYVKINRMVAVRNFARLLHEEETYQARYEKAVKDLKDTGFDGEGDLHVVISFAKRSFAPYQPSLKELKQFVERWFAFEEDELSKLIHNLPNSALEEEA